MGFCMYGATFLLGTIAIEVAPIHITGSAAAMVGFAANGAYILSEVRQTI